MKEFKRNNLWIIFATIILLCASTVLAITIGNKYATFTDNKMKEVDVSDQEPIEVIEEEPEPDPIPEYYDIIDKFQAIGSSNEEEVWGYNVTKVLGVIYHEAGATYCSDDLVRAVTTCIYNTSIKEGMTPEEVVSDYGYATPYYSYSSRVLHIFIDVFVNGNISTQIQNSELFYLPSGVYGGYSKYHETQRYICSIDNVKFFEIR